MFERLINYLLTGQDLKRQGKLRLIGHLIIRKMSKDGIWKPVEEIYGECITRAFADLVVDRLHTSGNLNLFKWHEWGTGTTAEGENQPTLETPTTEDRDEGTQAEGSATNIYRSVAEHTWGNTYTLSEWGIFSASITATGTMGDRAKLTNTVSVVSGDKTQSDYQLTVTPGG